MGMGQKHYRFHGTKEEIEGVLKVIPQYAADRWIEKPHKIYDHMNKQLGVEIWECCVSKAQYNDRVLNPIYTFAAQHPKFLYEVTYARSGKVIEPMPGQPERNFNPEDPSFVGPFGALCKLYGVPYFSTEEARLANVARYEIIRVYKYCYYSKGVRL